jgi:hypothetical protein
MTKYQSKFTVADAARILKVDKAIIQKWAFMFSEYMGVKANPSKGITREFQLEDIRVMAHIYTEWEDDPDIECIKIGLNRKDQFENPYITDLISSLTPIFIDPPEDIDETWTHGAIFAGLSSFADLLPLARAYKLAGDRLTEIAVENEEAWLLICPIMFNYRHSIELYLKVITGEYKQNHNLIHLYNKLTVLLKNEFNLKPPEWLENTIVSFNDFDPSSTTFRYGGGSEKDEVFIDFVKLKGRMGWLSKIFQNILHHKGITY